MRLTIEKWAAWSPGMGDLASWQDWLSRPHALHEADTVPALGEMPAAMRRRASRLGRAALQATYWSDPEPYPVVFASRYGEIVRSVEMLEQLAMGEPLSPTAFSMSVHNAVGALFSIATRHQDNYSAIAAGEETVEAAFIEAAGLLADGASHVTVVYYEAALPSVYRSFDAVPACTRAWACRLKSVDEGGFSLTSCVPSVDEGESLPSDLRILHFLLSGKTGHLSHNAGRCGWIWTKYD